MKPFLLDSEITVIGATTFAEAHLLLQDEAFKRRFSQIVLQEPSMDVLLRIKHRFEDRLLKERIVDDKIMGKIIATLGERLPQLYFPDKMIDYLDYLFSYKKILQTEKTNEQILEEFIYDQTQIQ